MERMAGVSPATIVHATVAAEGSDAWQVRVESVIQAAAFGHAA